VISDNTVTNQNKETIAKTRTNYMFRINEKNMRLLTLDSLKVGDEIPALTIPPSNQVYSGTLFWSFWRP